MFSNHNYMHLNNSQQTNSKKESLSEYGFTYVSGNVEMHRKNA